MGAGQPVRTDSSAAAIRVEMNCGAQANAWFSGAYLRVRAIPIAKTAVARLKEMPQHVERESR
jgi:hypothetical protein